MVDAETCSHATGMIGNRGITENRAGTTSRPCPCQAGRTFPEALHRSAGPTSLRTQFAQQMSKEKVEVLNPTPLLRKALHPKPCTLNPKQNLKP